MAAEETLQELAAKQGKEVATHQYGLEINTETFFAICKADLLLKGEGEAADNLEDGPEHSPLPNDANLGRIRLHALQFASWQELEDRAGAYGRQARHARPALCDWARRRSRVLLVTRSSDAQMLFLANKLSKMKQNTALGSRIAEVDNGAPY